MKPTKLPNVHSTFRFLSTFLVLHGALTLSVPSARGATISFGLSDIVAGKTIANQNQTTVSGDAKTYTSTIGFSTSTAYLSNSDASYSGPDIYGGAYRQQVYASAQTENPGTWYQTRTDLGLYSRRNGPSTNPVDPADALTVRLGSLFDAGGSFTLDSSSSFDIKLTGAGVSAAITTGYLFLQNGADLYRSVLDFDPNAASQNFGSLDTGFFQKVTVDSSTLALTDSGSTVLGSTLTDITKGGFFIEIALTGASPGGPSPQINSFSATFAPVPEPSSAVLLLGGLAGMLLSRRRRN